MHTKQSHGFFARTTVIGLLGALLGAVTTPAMANQTTTAGLDDIPTRIVLPTDPVLYPDPICLGCKIIATRAKGSSEVEDASGTLTVTYQDPQAPMFVGDIVLTVFLQGTDERRTVTIDGVWLIDGETVELSVEPGVDWAWDEVESVWVELVPAG